MGYENKVVELKADVHAVWRLQCKNLYNSKNLAALAVRECLQNSLDSVRAALKAGIIENGKISVGWKGDNLWVEDNGLGMDIPTIHEKFLTLGGTTKGDGDDVGGFGLAKSVILGCGSGFMVETQDNIFTSEDLGKNPIRKQEYRQGTKITCYDAQVEDGKLISDMAWEFKWSVEDYICSSIIPPNITIDINGEPCKMMFKPNKSTKRLPAELGIGDNLIPRDTELKINVYKTDLSVKNLYVRLRGLTQFKTYLCWNANCDIVLDINTDINPRDTAYPFSTNREGLKAQYQGIIEAIRDKVSQSPLSIARDNKYKETLYDNTDDGSKSSINSARELTGTLLSPQVFSTVHEVSEVVERIKGHGGFTPQGGYVPATLVDYIEQYNREMESIANKHNVSRSELVKHFVPDTLFKLNNPLSYSWIIYEDKGYKHNKLNKNTLVSITVVWDAVLKLMAGNSSVLFDKKPFYPGIIMENKVMGMCLEKFITKQSKGEKRCYVMLNPFLIPEGTSTKIALYLMGVASHELAHFICGSYEAHGETFSYTREAIMNHNLDALEDVKSIIEKSKFQKLLRRENPYKDFTLDQLTELATERGVNVQELKSRYSNVNIFRMRLVMALKGR